MILLDTNVLSALMREPPDDAVIDWLDRQDPAAIWTTSVTVFELRFGVDRMARGRRRAALQAALDDLLREDLAGHVAPLDRAAAEAAASLAARREAAGRSVDVRDTLIAGIALAHGATVATRNVRHYADLGSAVTNPWTGRADPS